LLHSGYTDRGFGPTALVARRAEEQGFSPATHRPPSSAKRPVSQVAGSRAEFWFGSGPAFTARRTFGVVTIGSWTIPIRARRVNDTRVDEDGERQKFSSRILPRTRAGHRRSGR
jgi:hypothetical protein